MMKYEKFDPIKGDIILFCCEKAKESYPNTIGYEASEQKFCIYSVCKGLSHEFNHYLSTIDHCPYCGKKIEE